MPRLTRTRSPVAVAVGRETVEYELHGQTVQGTISGVLEIGGGQGPNGYKTWAVSQATSRRAPKGMFDQLKPINAVMTESLQMNSAWNQKVAAFVDQRRSRRLPIKPRPESGNRPNSMPSSRESLQPAPPTTPSMRRIGSTRLTWTANPKTKRTFSG